MKNRLQFNRIPFLYSSGETIYSGTSVGLSGRETALSGLTWFTTRRNFIPLIGEPIVVRYIDDKGRKQLMLAIGKATGSTADDTYGIEYHVIDSAKLQEDIDLANEHAAEALELASGATKDTADYLTILKNMIVSGIGLTDGSYFDNNGRWDRDPSHVGLYDAIENANFIGEATSFREADDMLDKALKKAVDDLAQLSGATEDFSGTTKGYLERIIAAAGLNEQEPGEYPGHDETHFIKDATNLDNADVLLDAAIWNLSADTYNTIAELSAGTIQLSADTVATIEELSAGTVSGLEFLSGISENIINAAGLEADGTYEHKHDANFIDDATSLFDADVILDTTLAEFSANTVAGFEETNNNLSELSAATVEIQTKEEKIIEAAGLEADGSYPHTHNANFIDEATSLNNADIILDATLAELSANTMAADQALEDAFNEKIDELSANTMAADQVLDNKIDELSANTMAADHAIEEAFNEKIGELSANTMAADQVLQDQIDELDNRKVLGVSAITVETLENGDSKVSLVINEEDDKVLTQNALGLKANVSLVYNREDKKIYLKGKNDTTISEVDARDFIKDGMLSAASVFTATETDHEQYPELVVGKTYIKLLFNVDGEEPGRANPVFISAEDLVDIYSVDPESHTFMEINDYLIKLNVDKENGLASYNYARNISAVTANIISATGLNMGEQGGYPGHDETHYIKNAGSLDQADVLLDEAIWGNNQGLAELSATTESFSSATHTVIENILAGTGLNTQEPGEYHGHDETHYIKDATSLDNADVKLDEALWALSGVVADMGSGEDLERLSAVTREFSATTDSKFRELSAWTEEIDEVTAGALNDLNRRVGTLETHFTGEYMPLTNYVISEGITEEELLITDEDSVNDAFGKVQKQILDNEETTAAGLNDLNDRLTAAEEEIRHNTGVTALSAAVMSFSAATVNEFNNVHNDITEIEGDITEINNNVTNLSSFTQYLSANSLGMLTVNLNGVEQGKYCPSASTTLNLEAIQEVTGADVLLTGYEISTGTTEEELAIVPTDNVNEAFGKVQKQLYDDEAVTAGALNDLDSRVIDLDERVVELSGVVADDELVVAAALNDLNRRVTEISGNTGGLGDDVLTGVSVDGVAQPVSNHVANIQISIPTVNGFFDGAEYDSDTNKINFYHGQDIVDSIDADDFAALYGAGSGISITNDKVINLKLANKGDSSYIKLDSDGLYLTGISAMAGEIQALSAGTLQLSADTHNKIQQLSAATTAISSNLTQLSAATTAISNNVTQLSAATTAISNNLTQLSAATTGIATNLTALSAASVTMSGDINENRTDIDSLSASLIDDEFVIAAALNDLNRRVVEISGNTGGGGSGADVGPLSAAVLSLSAAVVTISGNSGGSGITTESDPVFTASPAHGITSQQITNWNAAEPNVQSDWNVTDTTSDAYIKNKPYIPKIQKLTTAEYNALTTKDPDTLYILVD